MIRCVCSGCSAAIEADDDAAGTAVLCARCGYLVQIPEQSAAKPAAVSDTARSAAPAKAAPKDRRPQYVIGGMYGLFVICLPMALTHVQDGSPICLAMFAVNLALGTASGFLFFVGMHTPDYLTDWIHTEFNRLRALAIFLPLTILGFAVAIHIFSP